MKKKLLIGLLPIFLLGCNNTKEYKVTMNCELLNKDYGFTINKGKDFELVTQTMDYNENLEIELDR